MFEKFVRTAVAVFILVIAVTLTLPVGSLAQNSGGAISGTVSDPSGAVVPGATVTAKNIATGVETKRQSTDAGLYVITPLPPGQYQLIVAVTGFQTLVQSGIDVDAIGATTVNLVLKVGNVSETITVENAPAELNTNDARLGTTIRNDVYAKLPLAMGTSVAGFGIGQGPRNPGAFIFLLPGVSEGNRNGTINGSQGFAKEVFIEGVPITDPVTQSEGRTLALGVSVEAIEQFQVETSGTGVEFSGQGAENYTIKSGGSQFHVTGFEYLRNTSLNARGFIPATRPVEHQNEFGFTVGGPIIKKKLFFFFSYDGWRYRVTSPTQLVSIPTAGWRVGDFSDLPASQRIFDPLTTSCIGNVCTRTQFADPTRATTANPLGLNIIPLARLSAISKVYQAPLPTPTSAGLSNNFLGQVPVAYDNNSYNLKIDYNLTESQRLSGIYTYGKRTQPGFYREVNPGSPQSALPLPYTNTRLVEEIPTVIQLKHFWTLSSNLINTFSFGRQRLFVPITNATSADKWGTKSGIQGLPAGDARDAFLEASFTGNNSPAGWRGTDSRDFEDDLYNMTIQDTFLWIRGKHSFKFGGQYQRTKDVYKENDTGSLFIANFNANQTAGFNANSNALTTGTGHAYASYLLGALSTATVTENTISGVEPTVGRYSSTAFWIADDWKVTKKLTLNLGLRYDVMIPYTEDEDRFSFLDPTISNPAAGGRPGVLRFGGNFAPDAVSCKCSTIYNTYYGAVGPRVGFAYAWDDKTVIRAGYGIMYTRRGSVGGRENGRNGTGFLGINASPALVAANAYDPAFYWQNGIPTYLRGPIYDQTYLTGFTSTLNSGAAGGTLTYGNPDSVPPRYINWNFSIQRSLTSSLVMTAAYVGSKGTSLAGAAPGKWTNQIEPRYLALGNLLTATANNDNIAAANLIIPGITRPYATFVGTIGQMLKPFPQYGGVAAPFNNDGQSNYHALQMTFQQRLAFGLTFNLNYTFSKAQGTINGFRNAYFHEKNLSTTDQPHILNSFYSYDLPFGKGKMFDPSNKVVRAIVSGWQITGVTRASSGTPLGPFTANCTVPQAGTCWANYNPSFTGDPKLKGDGTVTPYINVAAFAQPAAFTFGNTQATGSLGLRLPRSFNQDLSISRNFQARENLRFVFGADGFNIFNNVRLGGYNLNIGNTAFGRATTQLNLPRVFQFKFRIEI